MTHKEKAIELLKQKYHCSQALLGAFAEDFGLALKTAFKISACFGGGMRQGTTCGCITGGLLALGLAFGFTDPQDISVPEEMAVIRQEGLILQKCPRAFFASIEILEKMLEEYGGELLSVDLEEIDINEDEEIQIMLKNMSGRQRFRRHVRALSNETERKVAFIQFDICRFKWASSPRAWRPGNRWRC